MIWYKEELAVDNAPSGTITEIVGIFDPKGINIISVILRHISDSQSAIEISLYSHNPSMLRKEEPSKDDIYDRYAAKIIKLKSKYSYYESIKNAFRNIKEKQE